MYKLCYIFLGVMAIIIIVTRVATTHLYNTRITKNNNLKQVDVVTSKNQGLHKLNYCKSPTIVMNIQ